MLPCQDSAGEAAQVASPQEQHAMDLLASESDLLTVRDHLRKTSSGEDLACYACLLWTCPD